MLRKRPNQTERWAAYRPSLSVHWLRVPPPKIVPLSASERQSGVVIGTVRPTS